MSSRIVREFGVDMYTLLYSKWITDKDLLNDTWNSIQYMWRLDGRGVWGRRDPQGAAEFRPCLPGTNATPFVHQLYLNTKEKV